jgi:RHS repeat-associated protein
MFTGGVSYYYHYDALGSVRNVTSSTGVTQWTDTYEPYGAIRMETKNNNQAPTNFVKFTGEYNDPTGLYYLRARQYDPSVGRFLRPDANAAPSEDGFGSAYAYVGDQPTVLVDPTGMTSFPSDDGTGAAFLASSSSGPLNGRCAGGTSGPAINELESRIIHHKVVSASFVLVCPPSDITEIYASGLIYYYGPPYKKRALQSIGSNAKLGTWHVRLVLYSRCVEGTWTYQAIGKVIVLGPAALGQSPWASRSKQITC